MSDARTVRHWQVLRLRGADAVIEWLVAVGLTEHATYRDEQDASLVTHAE